MAEPTQLTLPPHFEALVIDLAKGILELTLVLNLESGRKRILHLGLVLLQLLQLPLLLLLFALDVLGLHFVQHLLGRGEVGSQRSFGVGGLAVAQDASQVYVGLSDLLLDLAGLYLLAGHHYYILSFFILIDSLWLLIFDVYLGHLEELVGVLPQFFVFEDTHRLLGVRGVVSVVDVAALHAMVGCVDALAGLESAKGAFVSYADDCGLDAQRSLRKICVCKVFDLINRSLAPVLNGQLRAVLEQLDSLDGLFRVLDIGLFDLTLSILQLGDHIQFLVLLGPRAPHLN